jgi:hypothetical protein
MHRRQVQLYQQEQRAISVIAGWHAQRPLTDLQIEKLRAGITLLTDATLRARLAEIDVFLTRVTHGSLEAAKAHEAIVGGLDDQQLEATMREEIMRCAHTWSDEEWAVVDEIRRTKKAHGARAAMLVGRQGMARLAREARGDGPDHTEEDT